MPNRNSSHLKKIDKLALWYLGLRSINDTPREDTGALEAVLHFWTSQSNLCAIFATIFMSTGVAFLVEFEDGARWVALPFALASVFFLIRTWAYSQCARIAARIWL